MRRVPVQARSRRRYEAILDAAAELFAADGVDATTVEAIAAKAETSIGSVYQFFGNKAAVFDALAERTLDRQEQTFDALLTDEALALPWDVLVDAVLDGMILFEQSEPGFRAMLGHVATGWVTEAQAVEDRMAQRIRTAVRHYAPQLDEARAGHIADLLVKVTAVTTLHLAPLPPSRAAPLLEELKLMLKRYLAPYLP